MKYKEFSKEIWRNINQVVDEVIAKDPHPVAAFDADGTLWDTDLGESFFEYEIDHKLVPLPSEPWKQYESLKAGPGGPEKGFLWLAQIHQGVELAEVRKWAKTCVEALQPIPIFSEQKKLISLLQSKGVEVYVVTASIKWAVEPGAALLGIPEKNVIGVETKVKNQIVTDELEGIVTYKKGKVDGLLKATQGKFPFLCSGNTEGDLPLLEAASHLRLAVSAASRDDHLFKTENALAQSATDRKWISHRFI